MKGASAGTVKLSDTMSLIQINFSEVPQGRACLQRGGPLHGGMRVVRLRAVRGREHGPSFGALIVISWPSVSQTGMPTKVESEQHYAFEDGLQAAEERDRTGVLAAAVTGEGKVEWYYLARSHDEFMRVLNKTLQGKPRLPITISLEKDPQWSAYRSLAGGR